MAKMGRPPIEIKLEQLESLMRMNPTLEDTANFFMCSPGTIEQRIRDEYDLTFREFREQRVVHTRLDLKRNAVKMAMSGNATMAIFCLKNMCDWSDNHKVEQTNKGESKLIIDFGDAGDNDDSEE